jgi:hypothetical protein
MYGTVEDAVKANPERALQALATHLGLPYKEIRESEERREAVAARMPSSVKRKPDAEYAGTMQQCRDENSLFQRIWGET